MALQALAKPKPSTADGPDLRSVGQRNADALADLVAIALASDRLPSTGGQQPLVTVQIPLATLKAKGHWTTADPPTWTTSPIKFGPLVLAMVGVGCWHELAELLTARVVIAGPVHCVVLILRYLSGSPCA